MKIALTGSSGFIGSYLLKKLNELNHNVLTLDRTNGFDVSNWNVVKDLPKFDVCIHLAAKSFVPDSYKNVRDFYDLNIIATLNMLEISKKYNAKMIFTSSYVYGKPQYLPIDEKHKLSGFNPYAHSKIICEQLCEKYSIFFGLPIIIFRPFNIYGYGQAKNFLIPEAIEKILKGSSFELLDSSPKRDMIYIDDLVKAFVVVVESNMKNEVFNIGSGISYSVDQIVQMILNCNLKKIKVTYKNEARSNEVDNVIADISKAKNLLGWEPKISLEEGIRKTVSSYLNNNNNNMGIASL